METVVLTLNKQEAWMLEAVFKGRGLSITPLFPVMQIIAEAIVEGEASGEVDEFSLWLTIDLLPSSIMLGEMRATDLLEKLYRLALLFYRGVPVPNAFKRVFQDSVDVIISGKKEEESADKDRAKARCEDTSSDYPVS